jgi:hypothetical protein
MESLATFPVVDGNAESRPLATAIRDGDGEAVAPC